MRPVQIPCRFFRQVIDSAYLCRACIDDIKILCCLFIYIYDIFVILSERGPERLSGVPTERLLFFGVEVGGGESKDLQLFFHEPRRHYTSPLPNKRAKFDHIEFK